ncbi:hypothetical protein Ddc_11599 [Ditylenchus destructor]|nr:hypothetical protein Ddc_11599 [Ditylenchus destructor]
MVQNKTAYPRSDTTCVFTCMEQIEVFHAIEKLRKEFLVSTNPCRLNMIFITVAAHEQILNFHAENSRTGEVLELKSFTHGEAKDKFDVDVYYGYQVLVLERHCI